MATFSTAYGLCPVIDSRSLVGVSEDEDGCAVVTIGKNMVIRCRISDQKQLNSWSTRLSKLTSQVVYDCINGNYVGVFDNIYIKQWTKSYSSIEKLKKHTVKNEIHEIMSHKKTSFSKPCLFVLFKNGSCMELESILKSKIEMNGILQMDEVIQSAKIISAEEKFLVSVVKCQNKYLCYCVKLEEEKYSIVPNTVTKVKLQRQGAVLLGHCIVQLDKGNCLLTYWSDGFLYSIPLPLIGGRQDIFKFLGTIHTVSNKNEMAMVPISYNQIVIYASDISEEGAFLGIYNFKFGLFQAQTTLKLFNKPPRIWIAENNIVVLMGQRLVCVPFTLQAEALSALACSKALHNNSPPLTQEVSALIPTLMWEETSRMNVDNNADCPEEIKGLLNICSSEGWSEYGISKFVLNKLLEAKDFDGLDWCLQNFIDIPEDFVVRLLLLVLNDGNSDLSSGEVSVVGNKMSGGKVIKSEFLNKVLRIPLDDDNLLLSLRLYFKFEDCLLLLNHLSTMDEMANNECDGKILVWIIVLLDAFYQQFILSTDSRVPGIILSLSQRIEGEIEAINELKEFLPLLLRFNSGKEIANNRNCDESYSFEKLRLYE